MRQNAFKDYLDQILPSIPTRSEAKTKHGVSYKYDKVLVYIDGRPVPQRSRCTRDCSTLKISIIMHSVSHRESVSEIGLSIAL